MNRPTTRSLRTALFGLLATLGFLALGQGRAEAQVVIYRLEFEQTGTSINYSFYEEGYYVADAQGGPGSFLLTFRDGPHFRFIQVTDFGSLFYASKNGVIRAVISAAASTGTPQTTFLAVGDLTQFVRAGNIEVEVAGELRGYVLSADDENILPFDVTEGDRGYAGFSEMRAFFQKDRADEANRLGQTVEEALADLALTLERRGYMEFDFTGEGDGDGDGTDGDGTDGDGDGDGTDGDGTDGDGTDGNGAVNGTTATN